MYTLIYKHNYHNRKPDLKLSTIDLLRYNIDMQEFILAAVEYAKSAAGKIVVCNNDGNIYADIDIRLGLFDGVCKEKFLKLANISEDFLILPKKSRYKAALSIRFYLNHSIKNLIKWLNV